jgi:hypothetical protein
VNVDGLGDSPSDEHFGDDPDRLAAAARYLQQGSPDDETP